MLEVIKRKRKEILEIKVSLEKSRKETLQVINERIEKIKVDLKEIDNLIFSNCSCASHWDYKKHINECLKEVKDVWDFEKRVTSLLNEEMNKPNRWLNIYYPKENRDKIKRLNITRKNLRGGIKTRKI